jgi:alkylated DNA repair dioxygenase AlkB
MPFAPTGQAVEDWFIGVYLDLFEYDLAVLDSAAFPSVVGERLGFDPAKLGRFVDPVVDLGAIGGSNHDGRLAPLARRATRRIGARLSLWKHARLRGGEPCAPSKARYGSDVVARSQLGLFAARAVAIDASFSKLTRTELADGAWYDYAPGWLSGDESLLQELVSGVRWHQEERTMYERVVTVPRLYATLPLDGRIPALLEDARRALGRRYAEDFERLSLGYYRSGEDSVAWHGDYVARRLPTATVATISVGAPRSFHLRRKGGQERVTLALGWGDLLVMGGTCQRTWEHAIPKVKQAAPRVAIMFRPVWQEQT